MCKMSKYCSFWHLEGNSMLLTPENDLCFRAHTLLVACYTTLHPALSVCPCLLVCRLSVRRSVTLYFFWGLCSFWPHCSFPNDGMTSIIAPAHPHATRQQCIRPCFIHRSHLVQCKRKNISFKADINAQKAQKSLFPGFKCKKINHFPLVNLV